MKRDFRKLLEMSKEGKIYTPENAYEFVYKAAGHGVKTCKKRGCDYYLCDIPAAFDIETTTLTDDPQNPLATMYAWTLGLNGLVMLGRTWDDLMSVMDVIKSVMHLSDTRLLPVYVHNLAFDWQFLRKHLEWTDVFAMETLKPMYAICDGFKFLCSYVLTGKTLAECGHDLTTYRVEKQTGDLDYRLKRHCKTPLTEDEKRYCVYDVLVVMAVIQEKIEEEGTVAKIPLTKTAYARRTCRKNCLFPSKNGQPDLGAHQRYMRMMSSLTLTHPEYVLAKRAFAGGFTHANAWYVGEVQRDITSYDFTSSYPAVMVCKKYPMSRGMLTEGRDITPAKFETYIRSYCCIMDLEFTDIKESFVHDHYISASRCIEIHGETTDNGRVVSAKKIRMACTEMDFDIIRRTYTWKKFRCIRMYRYYRQYLPKAYIETVLDLYKEKTRLKDVEGREADYQRAKEQVNSLYGMMVTDICRDDVIYDGEWDKDGLQKYPDSDSYNTMREGKISEYNTASGRFLSYLWGVYVAAYARHNLWEGIIECGDDYRYSDTDCIKIANTSRHRKFIDDYNARVTKEMEEMCSHYGIDAERTRPLTANDVQKPLGVWDYDGHYDIFKTLGAKRYLTMSGEEMKITVAGVNKKSAISYIKAKCDTVDECFNFFSDGMVIPGENDLSTDIYDEDGHKVTCPSGKMVHHYIHYETEGDMVDYMGTKNHWRELSSVALTPTSYTMGLSGDFSDFLMGLCETDA